MIRSPLGEGDGRFLARLGVDYADLKQIGEIANLESGVDSSTLASWHVIRSPAISTFNTIWDGGAKEIDTAAAWAFTGSFL